MNKFEKVSVTEYGLMKEWNAIKLPHRATKKSAGYDFYLPHDITLLPGETAKIATGIRVQCDDGWFLMICPRSSLGFKYRAQIDNTVGIIDGDYYYSDNEGHIFVKMTNDSRENKVMSLKAGEAFCQGIFLPYGLTVDDDANGIRNGGFGSTN